MTLPAFAAARRAAARAAIDRYRLPAGPVAANPRHAAAAGEWDRRTDTVPFHRPCCAYYSADNRFAEGGATL